MQNRLGAILAACLLSVAAAAGAQEVSRASLLPGWETPGGGRMIGVRIDLAPGWKTYWRAPGGSGIPPQFDFSASDNVAGARVHWPAPSLIVTGGVRTPGYSGSVVFPVELAPRAPGDMTVDLGLFYGVCEQVCIPVEDRLRLSLPRGATGGEAAIRASLDARARPAAAAGITAVRCSLRPQAGAFALRARLQFRAAAPAPQMVVFETGREDVHIATTAIRASDRTLEVDATLTHWSDGPLALDRGRLRLTLLGAGGAVEVVGCPAG